MQPTISLLYIEESFTVMRFCSLYRIMLRCMISISSCDPTPVETALLERPNHGFSHDFKTFHDDTYSDVSIGFHFKSEFHECFYFRDFGEFCNHLMCQIPPDLYDILRGAIIVSSSSPFDEPSLSGQNLKAEFRFKSPNIRDYTLTPHKNIIKVGTFILLNVNVRIHHNIPITPVH